MVLMLRFKSFVNIEAPLNHLIFYWLCTTLKMTHRGLLREGLRSADADLRKGSTNGSTFIPLSNRHENSYVIDSIGYPCVIGVLERNITLSRVTILTFYMPPSGKTVHHGLKIGAWWMSILPGQVKYGRKPGRFYSRIKPNSSKNTRRTVTATIIKMLCV